MNERPLHIGSMCLILVSPSCTFAATKRLNAPRIRQSATASPPRHRSSPPAGASIEHARRGIAQNGQLRQPRVHLRQVRAPMSPRDIAMMLNETSGLRVRVAADPTG